LEGRRPADDHITGLIGYCAVRPPRARSGLRRHHLGDRACARRGVPAADHDGARECHSHGHDGEPAGNGGRHGAAGGPRMVRATARHFRLAARAAVHVAPDVSVAVDSCLSDGSVAGSSVAGGAAVVGFIVDRSAAGNSPASVGAGSNRSPAGPLVEPAANGRKLPAMVQARSAKTMPARRRRGVPLGPDETISSHGSPSASRDEPHPKVHFPGNAATRRRRRRRRTRRDGDPSREILEA
jgi:hypothetical protein